MQLHGIESDTQLHDTKSDTQLHDTKSDTQLHGIESFFLTIRYMLENLKTSQKYKSYNTSLTIYRSLLLSGFI
jgi:hypothetical protein